MTNQDMTPKRQHGNDPPKENPTSVRNGKELIKAAVDALANDRCRTAIIQPQRRFFYLDCQSRAWNDISWHVVLCQLKPGNSDRWLSKSMADSENSVNFNYSGAPAQVSTGRFITSPRLVKVWADTRALEQEGRREDPKLCHYLVMRGASASAVQMFTMHATVTGALNSAFHALANGFEVVFAASILACEIGIFDKASLETCTDATRLKEVKASKDAENALEDSKVFHVKRVGIIY